jgi:BolA family transcriptional regulator, general stress-responsive regulator
MQTSSNDRVQRIREKLITALEATLVEVIDDSHLHAGHAGATDGKGHYTVRLVSSRFINLRPMARHQLVYQAVAEMMHTEIHALSIIALAPNEAT